MINIIREKKVPNSLITQEIKDYVDQCVRYKNDPDNNQIPTKPSNYRSSELLEAFDKCFFSKCYLTEEFFFNSWKMDVEHFIPQNENPSLVYEWTNLYPAEHKANMSKPRATPQGGYLDPCDNAHDVENQIVYTLTSYGSTPHFDPKNETDIKAVNTARLLNRLHSGHDNYSNQSTADLRHGIQKKYIYILEKICRWRELSKGTQEYYQIKNEIKGALSRKASFTSLLRSMPPVNQLNIEFPNEFFD